MNDIMKRRYVSVYRVLNERDDAFGPRRIAATNTENRELSDVFVSRDEMRITGAIKLIRG